MNKLEIYGILLLVLGLALTGAYFKGRQDEAKHLQTEQLAANAAELQKILDKTEVILAADEKGRAAADAFVNRMNTGLLHVATQFSKIPNVVVDTSGCARLADSFRLRWNAAAGVSAGSAIDRAGGADGAVPASPGAAP